MLIGYGAGAMPTLTMVKDARAAAAQVRRMTTLAADAAPPRQRVRDRRTYLKAAVSTASLVSGAAPFLILDAIFAIGFAGGIAGAVTALAAGSTVALWLVLAAAAAIGRGLSAAWAVRAGSAAAQDAKINLRQRVARSLFAPSSSRRLSGEIVFTICDEVEQIDGYLARFLPARQAAGLTPIIVLAATAAASPVSALILATTLIPFVAALALAGGAAADESRRQFEALSRLTGQFADRIRALPIILAFNAEDREAGVLGDSAGQVATRTLRVLRVAFLSTGALEFFAALSVALVAVYVGFSLLKLLPFHAPETLTLGRGFFVLALAPEFYLPMRRLAAAYHDKQAAETAADRLAAADSPETAAEQARTPLRQAPSVRFDQVTIRYPGTDTPAISGFTLDVPAGRSVAIVGPSGVGKSSLLHLLLGLAPLSGGEILVDGERCGQVDLAGQVGWLGQSPLIVPGTIRDNIMLARPDASEIEVAAAVRAAGLGPTILKRRCGLDGRLDARGGGLSGGERQRIGIARAILTDAPVLLLDEPTAHLDVRSEADLLPVLANACRGRTVLIATHSACLAAIADRTVSLDAGR